MAKPLSPKQQLGLAAENAACHYLQQQGLRLITRNFHAKQGEIDLIMLDKNTLVFVEVRFRSRSEFGDAAASVTRNKQQKIIATAYYFLHHHPQYLNLAARFDVVAIHPEGQEWHINWIPAAFLAA